MGHVYIYNPPIRRLVRGNFLPLLLRIKENMTLSENKRVGKHSLDLCSTESPTSSVSLACVRKKKPEKPCRAMNASSVIKLL